MQWLSAVTFNTAVLNASVLRRDFKGFMRAAEWAVRVAEDDRWAPHVPTDLQPLLEKARRATEQQQQQQQQQRRRQIGREEEKGLLGGGRGGADNEVAAEVTADGSRHRWCERRWRV